MLYSDKGGGRKPRKKKDYRPSDGYIERYDFRGQPTVVVMDFEPEVFKYLVDYTHTGTVMLQARTLLGLMNAADHYGLEELKLACIHFMEQCISVDTVCSLLSSAEKYIQYKSTKILVQKMFEFVDQNAEVILSLGVFSTLPQHVVRIVLGREELQASELVKFNAAFRWSLRHCDDHPTVSLPTAFEPFVDVIDFTFIPAKQLMSTVRPAGIVDDGLLLNALAFQADPKSVEHVSRARPRKQTSISPQMRRVQSSNQPTATPPDSVSAHTRGSSVPPLDSPPRPEGAMEGHAGSMLSVSSTIPSSDSSGSLGSGGPERKLSLPHSAPPVVGPERKSSSALDVIVSLSASAQAVEV